MEENQESIVGVMEKLAMITDATQSLFPDGKSAIVFEIPNTEFREIQKNFREIDRGYNKFKIDISGVEVIFILENSYEEEKYVPDRSSKKGFDWRDFKASRRLLFFSASQFLSFFCSFVVGRVVF